MCKYIKLNKSLTDSAVYHWNARRDDNPHCFNTIDHLSEGRILYSLEERLRSKIKEPKLSKKEREKHGSLMPMALDPQGSQRLERIVWVPTRATDIIHF